MKIVMIVLTLIVGCMLMVGAYTVFSLLAAMVFSYLATSIMQAFVRVVSLEARLNKQFQVFQNKKLKLKQRNKRQQEQVQRQLLKQQRRLDEKDCKKQLKMLVKTTEQLLNQHRTGSTEHLTRETRQSIKQSINQCKAQNDYEGLLTINKKLSESTSSLRSPDRLPNQAL